MEEKKAKGLSKVFCFMNRLVKLLFRGMRIFIIKHITKLLYEYREKSANHPFFSQKSKIVKLEFIF